MFTIIYDSVVHNSGSYHVFYRGIAIGWTQFSFIWVYNVRWCYGRKSPQICVAGDFTFFWRVRKKWFYLAFFWFSWWMWRLKVYVFVWFWREKLNSMNLLLYMAPVAVVLLLPATLYMEENVVGILISLAKEDIRIVWFLLFNSSLAYFVNLTNFFGHKTHQCSHSSGLHHSL